MTGWTLDSGSVRLDSTSAKLDGTQGGGLAGAATDAVSAAGALKTAAALAGAAADAIVAAAQPVNFAQVTLVAPLYTGVGGIFDPALTWPFSTPVVGSVISYDPTILTVLPNGETVWTTDSGIAEIQYNDGTNVNEVELIITPLMVGEAFDTTAASGTMAGGAAALASAAITLISASASLTTGIKLQAAATDLTTATAGLITAIKLLASATDATTAQGALAGSGGPAAALSGAATDGTTASAALTAQIRLLGAAADVLNAAGALTTRILMTASGQDSTLAAGALTTHILMSGSGQDSNVAAGALNAQVAFAGAATDSTTARGLLGSLQALFAAANDVSTAGATLMTQISLSASAANITLAQANLTAAIQLAAAAQMSSSAQAELGVLQLSAYPTRIIRTGFTPLGLGSIAGVQPYGEFFASVGDAVLYGIDWDGWLANYWSRGAMVPAGTVIRSRSPNGFEFSTVAGGQSGNFEPIWQTFPGATMMDGSVVWTCQPISTDSLSATVQSAQWKVAQDIKIDGQQISGQVVVAMIDTANAKAGVDYLIAVPTTMSDGETKAGQILIKVR